MVGDEYDLLTLDNKVSRYIANFSSLFLHEKFVMQGNQARFEEKIGRSFIEKLNTYFNGAFSGWYNSRSTFTQAPSTSTNKASGKQESHAAGLAYRLAQGEYTFCPHLFNFLSICRSFKHVLALSGSLNIEHMSAFRDFFSNDRPNLFVNIPPFFGSHNTSRNLKIRTESDHLSLDDWYAKIVEDIHTSIEHQQPILLFGSDATQLEGIKQIIEHSSLLESGYRCITITNESDLEKNFSEIGAPKTIILSNAICGRGIDIKVSKAIININLYSELQAPLAVTKKQRFFTIYIKFNHVKSPLLRRVNSTKERLGYVKLMTSGSRASTLTSFSMAL